VSASAANLFFCEADFVISFFIFNFVQYKVLLTIRNNHSADYFKNDNF